MTLAEFIKLWAMSYFEVIEYLLAKYGPVKYSYTNNAKNKGNERGLFVHHIDEYRISALSTSWAKKAYPECQKPARLVFCNLLEHFLLHLIIVRDFLKNSDISVGGIGQYIYPDLYQYFVHNHCKNNISINFYTAIEGSNEAFIALQTEYFNLKHNVEHYLKESYFDDGKPINKRYWSKEAHDILINNYKLIGAEGVQILLDELYEKTYPGSLSDSNNRYIKHARSISAIHNRAYAYNLVDEGSKETWTQREDKILIKYYKKEGEGCFKRLTNRSYNACRTRCRDLKLKTDRNIAWEPWEDEILEKLYIQGTWRAVQKELPHRSENSIIKRAKRILGSKLKIGKSVRCVETGEIFNSLASAAKFAGINHSGVSECINGTQQTAGGYHWERVYQ